MIKLNSTLSRYLARTYLANTIYLLSGLLAVVYLFDTVELIRRASKRADVPLGLVLQMGLLKLPEVGQILFPFAILFGAMFTFWQLTRRYELIVVRASGFSVWQFLAPVIAVAMSIGILQMAVINPIGAVLISKFDQLESKFLEREDSHIAVFKEGLWLRQSAGEDQGYVILHAERISQPDWRLTNLSVFFFDQDNNFEKRLDAKYAALNPGAWMFHDVVLYEGDVEGKVLSSYQLPTNLTRSDVEESFSSPQSMSFWRLPGHIQTLEETGFDASRLRVHYQGLLAQPLMFAAMVLLAACVSMRPPRFRGTASLFGIGIFIGFVVFFMSSFLQALGASHQLPVILAAWSPACICMLLGLAVMMNLEDG